MYVSIALRKELKTAAGKWLRLALRKKPGTTTTTTTTTYFATQTMDATAIQTRESTARSSSGPAKAITGGDCIGGHGILTWHGGQESILAPGGDCIGAMGVLAPEATGRGILAPEATVSIAQHHLTVHHRDRAIWHTDA